MFTCIYACIYIRDQSLHEGFYYGAHVALASVMSGDPRGERWADCDSDSA